MPRELSHQTSKFTFPIQLKGKSVIKSPVIRETLGRWDNLINQGKTSERVSSPERVVKRTSDNKHSKRTVQPQLNTENDKPQCRKIKSQTNETDPGSIMSLLKKSGTIKDVQPGSRKTFKEKGQVGETMYSQTPKTGIRVSRQKLDAYASQISTLASPTYTEGTVSNNYRDENGFRSSSPIFNSPSLKRKQHHMKSAIGILSNGEDTKRDYQDIDEKKIWQSVHSPKHNKHLESTFQHQVTPMTQKVLPRKDPNRNCTTAYDDTGRLNPYTRGKKVSYHEHLDRNTSATWVPTVTDSFAVTSSPKYGGMEPLSALFSGRRAQSPKAGFSNVIAEPPTYKDNIRGATVFSYRTYSSQIIF